MKYDSSECDSCETWLIHVWFIWTHSCEIHIIKHDSFVFDSCGKWHIRVWFIWTHSCAIRIMKHDSSVSDLYETWRIPVWFIRNHSCLINMMNSFVCDWYMENHSFVCDSYVWHDFLILVACLICACHVTYLDSGHSEFICVTSLPHFSVLQCVAVCHSVS